MSHDQVTQNIKSQMTALDNLETFSRRPYLGVGLGDLLVQTLVAVDGELQLLHL